MGYKFEVMKGKTLFELVPDFFTQEEAEVLKEKIMLCLKERKDISYRKQINNNEICQIKTLSPVFKDNGEIIRIIVSNMDILKLNDLNHTIHG